MINDLLFFMGFIPYGFINCSVMIINLYNVQEIGLQKTGSAWCWQEKHEDLPSCSHPHRQVLRA